MTSYSKHGKTVYADCYTRTLHPVLGLWVSTDLGLVFGLRDRPIGNIQTNGYVQVKAPDNRMLLASRVIWEAENGPIPEGWHIDHINGDRTDNRLCNLEAVPPLENYRRAQARKASSPVITARQKEDIRNTVGLVTDHEWAEDLACPVERIRTIRRERKWLRS